MALTMTLIDKIPRTWDLTDSLPAQGTITGIQIALLPVGSGPTAATVWTSTTFVSPSASIVLAAPQADSSGAFVVTGTGDLWGKVLEAPYTQAFKIERITMRGGSGVTALPSTYVTSVNGSSGAVTITGLAPTGGAGGALSGTYPNPGLNETTVDSVVAGKVADAASSTTTALRTTYGRAAPVLASFVYDGSGNLTSYTEDGIAIVLTYNADGTVATSKRGTEATQTYTYSGGNLSGVA